MKLYMRISALSFSNSAVSPVLPYLIVYYGGGATESGFFQAFNNLFGNLGQVLWGRVSDVSGLRKLLLALGSFSALLTPLILISILVSTNSLNPYLIILVSAIATFLGSASAPIIAPVISELAKSSKESVHLFAIHSNLSTFFSILGNVVATLILQAYLQSAVQGFANLFIIALLSAAIALTASLSIPRTVVDIRRGEHYKGRGFVHEFGKVVEGFRNSLKNPRFRGFAFTNTLYNLSMSIAWPLFILTQKNVLNLSPAQITTFSIASSVTTIASQYMMGMLLRRELYRFLTLLNRFGLVVVPLVYAYATNYTQLLLLNIYTGFLSGFTNIIFPMYIIECAGDGNRATYIGVYNMLIGTASFTGSLIGGSISTKLIESFGLIQGLKITYYICTIARIFSALLTLKSKEYVF
jgi:MFS family permease